MLFGQLSSILFWLMYYSLVYLMKEDTILLIRLYLIGNGHVILHQILEITKLVRCRIR